MCGHSELKKINDGADEYYINVDNYKIYMQTDGYIQTKYAIM